MLVCVCGSDSSGFHVVHVNIENATKLQTKCRNTVSFSLSHTRTNVHYAHTQFDIITVFAPHSVIPIHTIFGIYINIHAHILVFVYVLAKRRYSESHVLTRVRVWKT